MSDQPIALALERFTSFGDLLKFLRRREGLTQRELSISVGYSHAQVSRLELNQRPPDLATVTARFIPALCLDRSPEAAARLVELASLPHVTEPTPGTPPFKGMRSFAESDTDLFFGREALTAQLMERIRGTPSDLRFLAVVGASGIGKSSDRPRRLDPCAAPGPRLPQLADPELHPHRPPTPGAGGSAYLRRRGRWPPRHR